MSADLIAIWGAALSTILAIIKVVEFWRARFQFGAEFGWSSSREIGNKLTLHNLTARQIVVTHWRIFSTTRPWSWPFRGSSCEIVSADWDSDVTSLPAYSSIVIMLREENYFDASPRFLRGGGLYLEISAAGKLAKTYRLLPYRHPAREFISALWGSLLGSRDQN